MAMPLCHYQRAVALPDIQLACVLFQRFSLGKGTSDRSIDDLSII
jgi:hypothetical protein